MKVNLNLIFKTITFNSWFLKILIVKLFNLYNLKEYFIHMDMTIAIS